MSAEVASKLLTAREVAALLAISEKSVYAYASRQLIPYVRFQSNIRFRPEAIRRWIEEHECNPRARLRSARS